QFGIRTDQLLPEHRKQRGYIGDADDTGSQGPASSSQTVLPHRLRRREFPGTAERIRQLLSSAKRGWAVRRAKRRSGAALSRFAGAGVRAVLHGCVFCVRSSRRGDVLSFVRSSEKQSESNRTTRGALR